jgi:hypothetical protein
VKFIAECAAEAETSTRRKFRSSIAAMDWEKDFALLEDGTGRVIAHWFDGAAIA